MIKTKILLSAIILTVFFFGCEKEDNTVIDPYGTMVNFKVDFVKVKDTLNYILADTSEVVTAKVYSPQGVQAVGLEIIDPAGKMFFNGIFKDDGIAPDKVAGDSIYSAEIVFGKEDLSGDYNLKFSVFINNNGRKDFANATVFYFNGQENSPPYLHDLVMPDTVSIGVPFVFYVSVFDLNGLSDVKKVYYEIFNPSGQKLTNQQGISQFPLSDNGDTDVTGDETANDGIYTQKLTFPKGQPKGKWRFDFTAIDRSDSLSNTITHFIEVK